MAKILSICMMVKNEEKNLERCLESLHELMISIPSELIIVDTGSKDNTVAIAKRYTDKVYHHPWNNNFSEMRNITISYANGKWLFIIDADEELVNPDKLIPFFKKSYPKSIAGGALIVKNLTAKKADKDVVLLNSARIFRNDGSFRYEGAVHNMPVINGQILETEAIINHYGYDSTDYDLMEQKFIRTSTILKKELVKNQDNIYYRYQLSVTYMMHKDYEQALEEVELAYEKMKNSAADRKKYLYIYCQLARCYMRLGKYSDVEKFSLEGIALEKEYIDLYFYMAQAQGVQEKYELAINNYCHYMKLVESFDQLEIKRNPAINHYTLSHIDEALYNVSVMMFKINRIEQTIIYAEKLLNIDNVENEIIIRLVPLLIDACFATCKFSQLRDILVCKLKEKGITFFEQALLQIEKNLKKLDKKNKQEFLITFANCEGQYGLLNKIRLMYNNGQAQELAKVINEFSLTCDYNSLPDYYGDLLYYFIRLNKPEEMLGNLTELNAVRFLKYYADNYSNTLNEAILAYCEEDTGNDFKKLRSKKILLKYLLFSGELSDGSYLLIFKKYLTNGIAFMETIYTSLVLDNELIHDVKSVEEAFLLYMLKARSYKSEESYYVQYLKRAVAIFPEMNKGIKLLLQEIEKPVNNTVQEMADLKFQLIKHIRTLLEAGQAISAKKIIEEYEQVCGPDADSLALKSQAMLQIH